MGLNSFIYLDDGLGSRPDECSAAAAAMIQKKEPDLACVFSLMWHVFRPDLANFRPDEAFVWPVVALTSSFTWYFQFANLLGVGKLINAAQPTIAFGISSSDTDIALLNELALFISFTLCFCFSDVLTSGIWSDAAALEDHYYAAWFQTFLICSWDPGPLLL